MKTTNIADPTQAPELTAVSLFSGAGGLDLGLAAAGWNILYESDIDEYSCNTLDKNRDRAVNNGLGGFSDTIVETASALDLSGTEILRKIGVRPGELDLLAGGPPCQAFSVFGRRRGMEDIRGQLVVEYARLLSEMRPKSFVFENVYGLLTVGGGVVFESVKELLADPGDGVKYDLEIQRVDAANYSVPQHRDRVIIVGRRSDIGASLETEFEIPTTSAPTGSLTVGEPEQLTWRTVDDALSTLPKLGTVEAERIPNHRGRKHGLEVKERYRNLKYGERDSKTRINKLHPQKPSYTIVVGSDAGGGKGHVHPYESRELTPRESARIQTFPDWWEFEGNVRHSIRQVGNAVPCLLGYSIGLAVMRQYFNVEGNDFETAVSSLGQQHLFLSDQEAELIA